MPNQIDPQIKALTQAIGEAETGPSSPDAYTKKGASGEFGRYQFTPDTWKARSQKYIGNANAEPTIENQNKVQYEWVKDMKNQGYTPAQIASMHNAGEGKPNAYKEGFKGTNSFGVEYDVPEYVKKVSANYEKSKQQSVPTSIQPSQVASASGYGGYAPSEASVPTAQADTGTEAPKSFGQKALDVAGKVGDFIFPIAGDIKNLYEGDNQKTGLQIAGDLGMSVLPFVPGLGQAGLLAKGAKAASVVSKVAESAQAAKGAGLLSKVAASPVARATAAGYGTGVSQNLAEGKSIGESIGPNTSTILGTGLGAGAGLLAKGTSGILNKAAGVPENVKPVLSNLSNKGLYDEYINAAKARAVDVRNPSPLEVAADYTEKAAEQMQAQLTKLGEEVGTAKAIQGNVKLKDVTPVIKSFAQEVEKKFGLKVFVSPTGKNITLERAPGRMKDVLSTADQGRVRRALEDLLKLRKAGDVRKASDVLDNLDNLVDYSKKDLLGNSNDPLETFLKSTRHNLNGVVAESSPALATAKTRYSDLSRALESIKSAGGSNLQRAELLLKRVFSGDQSAKSREVFDIIKKETGVDLTEHAVLAKHAIDSVGDPSQLSLLSQILQNAAKEGSPTIPSLLLGAGKGLLNKTIANPEVVGRNIVKGKTGLVPGLLKKGTLEATALNLPRLLPTQEPQ